MDIDKTFLKDLGEYIALPSVSANPAAADVCVDTAEWVNRKLAAMGFVDSRLVATGGHPLVLATRPAPGPGAPHILVYGHYDVQPAEPLELWRTPPFRLTVKGNTAYARGVADNKGPTLALLYGLGDALKSNPNVKITCMIEGEEEIGSKNLHKTLLKLKKSLGPIDMIVISDTESPAYNRPSITTGMRGILALDVTIGALARDLHSGNGGPVPNAVRELTRVMGGLYDAQGWVNIPGFYRGIQPAAPAELAALKKLYNAKKFAQEIGAKGFYPLEGLSPFQVNRFYPSLELNGIKGGYQGEGSKTIVPATATAKITCRIAPGQSPDALRQAVVTAIRKRVNTRLFTLDIHIHEAGSPAYVADLSHLGLKGKKAKNRLQQGFLNIEAACKKVLGVPPLYVREGASIPILSNFQKILGADAIMLGLAQEGSGMHSPYENVDLRLLSYGRQIWAQFFRAF